MVKHFALCQTEGCVAKQHQQEHYRSADSSSGPSLKGNESRSSAEEMMDLIESELLVQLAVVLKYIIAQRDAAQQISVTASRGAKT